jgi:glycosyltransferase involved in cell wall biosynthesis
MPAYDVERYVDEAVASVARQSLGAWELIAVDDGSTDGTAATLRRLAADLEARSLRMTVIEQANAGAAAARNAGLRRARGDHVAFMDADDRWRPELLARLHAQLETEPGLDLAFPRYDYIDAEGARMGIVSQPRKRRFDLADLLVQNPIHSATGVLVRRRATDAVGLFDEALRATIDLDYWVRVAALRPANIGCVPEVLAEYRRRDGQITGDWRRMRTGWLRVRDKAEAMAWERARPVRHVGYANRCLYWSTLAYAAGDYAGARQQILAAWRAAPRTVAADGRVLPQTLACLASLLPPRLHAAIRDGYRKLRVAGDS